MQLSEVKKLYLNLTICPTQPTFIIQEVVTWNQANTDWWAIAETCSILQKLLGVRRHCGLCKISPCGTFSLSRQTPCTHNVWKVWHVRLSVPHKTSPRRTFLISCQTCPAWPAYLENTALVIQAIHSHRNLAVIARTTLDRLELQNVLLKPMQLYYFQVSKYSKTCLLRPPFVHTVRKGVWKSRCLFDSNKSRNV